MVAKGEDSKVYLFDSLCKQHYKIHPSIQFQLSALYGKGLDLLDVHVVKVDKQNNNDECGVYALANLLEFVSNGCSYLVQNRINFNPKLMRQHLIKCLECRNCTPFPKL